MGLDTVELVMEIEDRFGIKVPDAAAEKMQTLGDIHAFVLQAVSQRPESMAHPCDSQRIFYRVRRLLMSNGVAREALRTSSRIQDFISPRRRELLFRQIAQEFNVITPDLGWDRKCKTCFGLAAFAVVLLAVSATVLGWPDRPNFVIELISGVMLAASVALAATVTLLIAAMVVQRFAPVVPAEVSTVAEVVRLVQRHERARNNALDANEVWAGVCEVISYVAAVDPKKLRPEMHVIKDLGLD